MRLPKLPFLPDLHLVAELINRRRYQRAQEKEERGRGRQWFLLCGPTGKEALLNPKPASLQKLIPPTDRSWADPFLWKHKDEWFVFCEEWHFNQRHGHIAVMKLSLDCQEVISCKPVLTPDHHLSHPFLFEYDGALHMLPEAAGGRSIEAYRCEEFPDRWRKTGTLMRNLQYADATLLQHGGTWWLFVTIRHGLFGLNRDLFLFWADTPLTDRWQAHPANPVVRAFTRARPAGRVFELDGKLFRPSQNCLVRYGHGLNINQILRLDAKQYEERLVTEVAPNWEAGIRGNHHIDWHEGMLIMDAQRLLPAEEPSRGAAD